MGVESTTKSEARPSFKGSLQFFFLKRMAVTLHRQGLEIVLTMVKFRFTSEQHSELKALKGLSVPFMNCCFQDDSPIPGHVETFSKDDLADAAKTGGDVFQPKPAAKKAAVESPQREEKEPAPQEDMPFSASFRQPSPDCENCRVLFKPEGSEELCKHCPRKEETQPEASAVPEANSAQGRSPTTETTASTKPSSAFYVWSYKR